MQAGIVRQPMTIATTGDTAVLSTVTRAAGQFAVGGFAGCQSRKLIAVTRLTIGTGQVVAEDNLIWRMGDSVADQTIGIARLFVPMRFVAVEAVARLTVAGMTAGTTLLRMSTGLRLEDRTAFAMTGQTGRCCILSRRHIVFERLMGTMTPGTVGHGKMGAAVGIVTVAAGGKDILVGRRVGNMTADTRFLFMLSPFVAQLGNRLFVTRLTHRLNLLRSFFDVFRPMRGMTAHALAAVRPLNMGFVTIETRFRCTVMTGVAFTAIELGVFTPVVFQKLVLSFVTRHTQRRQLRLFPQIDLQGLMGIVAFGTPFQAEMAASVFCMAAAAGNAQDLAVGLVLGMTGDAAVDLALVPPPIVGQLLRLFGVAIGTELAGNLIGRCQLDQLWLMGQMAQLTVGSGHRFIVTVVTVGAPSGGFVIAVTFGAILLAMATGFGRKIGGNILVTTDAHRPLGLPQGQIHFQWLMGIVTLTTIADGKMGLCCRGVTDETRRGDTHPLLW